jgi:copper transporter 1
MQGLGMFLSFSLHVLKAAISLNATDGSDDSQMLWNWHTIDACFISESWHIQNNAMFAATCIGVILLVVLVEFLRRLGKEYDSLITRGCQRQAEAFRTRPTSSGCSPVVDEYATGQPNVVTYRATLVQQTIRALIHAATFAGAYITMLLAMYYNGYIIICIFIGAGLGKFLCDWMIIKIDLTVLEDGDCKRPSRIEPTTTVCCD